MPTDAVCLFPAWETLPFERVSPAVETMGRRMEVVWRLRQDVDRPRIVVASVRSLLQKLAPNADVVEPIRVAVKGRVDIDYRPVHDYTLTDEIDYIKPKARVY